MRPPLVLFDIDGTLLRTHGAGRAAMTEAGRHLFGVADLFGAFDFAGAVDSVIVRAALRAQGLDPTPRRLGLFQATYLRALRRRLAQVGGVRCPGVDEALHTLGSRAPIGLLTGNWRDGAEAKLETVGLGGHFPPGFGGYGGDAADRSGLLPVALRRAARRGLRVDRVVVIGDTEADVRCARQGHRTLGPGAPTLITIGVRTGFASPGSLEQSQPDHLVDRLSASLIEELLA
jgi:phosphoglycolate phosphatase-like HAD superfamily hydrolase